MKQWKRVLCVILCFLIVSGIAERYETTAHASELTNESIRQKEQEISKAREEKKALQNGLTDVKELKKELEASKENLTNYVTQLDAQLVEIQAKINNLKERFWRSMKQ